MDNLRITTHTDEFDLTAVHQFLCRDSYWAKGIALEKFNKSIANSLCFAGFVGATQVAFGRAVTDLTSFAFLRDIFVLPDYRGHGFGKLLVNAIMARLEQEGVPAVMLGTADAHGLYAKFGFQPVGNSPKLMAWHQENAAAD